MKRETWTLSLNGFNPVRGVCAFLAVGLVAFGANTPSALAASITVGNHSFETEGTFTSGAWYQLPDVGSWVKGQTNLYQIVDTSIANPHFTAGNAPEGSNVLNLQTASPLTQGLSHAVSIGDLVTMSFYLGNSTGQADPPASPTATLTLDGSDAHSEIVNNDAADGAFVLKTVQWTATSAGNLGIKFASAAGCWLDNVSVTVIDPTVPLFMDDFEGHTVGAALEDDASWTKSTTFTSNVEDRKIRDANTSTAFGTPNQFVEIIDDHASNGLEVKTASVIAGTYNALTTFSFDFHEPTGGGDGNCIFGYTANRLISTERRAFFTLNNGTVGGVTGGDDNTYALDAVYTIFLVLNDTLSATNYNGKAIAAETADVWLQASGSPAVYAGSMAAANSQSTGGYGVAVTTFSGDIQTLYFDNVLVETGVPVHLAPPAPSESGGMIYMQ